MAKPTTKATKSKPKPTKEHADFDPNRLTKKRYAAELERMEKELVKLQEWVRSKKLRVVVVFEGRDAAGKGGVIKTIAGCLNPRVCRIVALTAPNDREKGQWYFQRYITQLPSAGEIVLFDRSWYNRAGVERVMGFCTDEELDEFFRAAPEFERMLVRSGFVLIKYWFSVSDDEQEKRFHARIENPVKRWKLSPMDLEARARWVDYSRAKDDMFAKTDTSEARWWVVPADEKKRARLNCIAHLLESIPYKDLTPKRLKLPPRQKAKGYQRPPEDVQHFVPEKY
ncbi:MAG TPA: polyphosphate kinase 2 [Labilithrix sp.]|nr:polyphosphate kinase 2 [Labilithrix sp.]